MPGDSPYEAYVAFVEPLKAALSCIAHTKITVSPDGKHAVDRTHSWTLQRGLGARLRGGFRLDARMKYQIIRDDREGYGPYRVTTKAYDYALCRESDGVELFAQHWHPDSTYTAPHMHLGSTLLNPDEPLSRVAHIPTSRATLEQAIRLSMALGVEPICDDWDDRLTLAEGPHVLFRSWHGSQPTWSDQ